MFNKVWGASSFLILMVQTFGCYHLAGGCRARVLQGGGGKDQFYSSGARTACERRRLGFRGSVGEGGAGGGIEVRAAQKRFAHRHRPFLLSVN